MLLNNSEDDFENITTTAIYSSHPRTLTDIPYSKEIFNELEKIIDIPSELIHDSLAPVLEARYKLMDKLLKENEIKQVLEIASGYSQRGIISSKQGINYIEFDLEPVCKIKKAILKSITRIPNNLHILSGNALEIDDFKKCEEYIESNKKLAIIHEGFFRYLTFKEKEQVAKNIYELLSKYGGVWITCDITQKKIVDTQNKTTPTIVKVNEIIKRHQIDDRYNDLNEIKEVFENIGFDIEIHYFSEVKEELVSPKILNLTSVDENLESAIMTVMKIKKF